MENFLVKIAGHKLQRGIMYDTRRHVQPNSSTSFHNILNYYNPMEHSAPKPDVTFESELCYEEFRRFNASQQHENSQHGFPIKTTNINRNDIITDVDDTSPNEELRFRQHFHVIS